MELNIMPEGFLMLAAVSFSAVAVVLGLTVVARRSLFLRRSSGPAVCERGISTLEWILLVAAVGGIVTLGILIVRRGYGEAGEQVDGAGAAGQTLELAQADAEKITSQGRCGTEPPIGGLLQWSGMFTFKWDTAASRCVAVHTNILGDSS